MNGFNESSTFERKRVMFHESNSLVVRLRKGSIAKKCSHLFPIDDCVYVGLVESGNIPRSHYQRCDGISSDEKRLFYCKQFVLP
jgi:hypothetical protein